VKMSANEEMVKEITKGMTETIEKALPELVEKSVVDKMTAIKEADKEEMEEVKAELKKINLSAKKSDTVANEAFKKEVVVNVFKEVMNNNITTEKAFKETTNRVLKEMSEGTATEGAELVFDQFETDILRVINDFQIVSDVRILQLAKGDKVSLPKATNGITTYFVAEGAAITGDTEAATAFVVIDISKAMTLTNMTTELLDDTMTTPDLYNLIVEFIGESQGEFLETQILTGTGSVKGILVNTSVNNMALAATEKTADIDDATIVEMVTTAARKFKRNSAKVKFYGSQYVYGKLKALLTTDGYPLYPSLRDANPKLMGYEFVLSDVGFVQNSTEDVADAVTLLFGDLSYFTLARRKGITIERGYYWDNWAQDIQSIKSNSRYGGTATFPEAFVVLANGAAS